MNINYYFVFLAAMGGFLVGSILKSYLLAAFDAFQGEDVREVLGKIQGKQALIKVSVPDEVDREDALEIVASHALLLRGRLRPCECCGALDGQHYLDEDGDSCPLDFAASEMFSPDNSEEDDGGDGQPN